MWLRNSAHQLDGFSGGVADSQPPSSLPANTSVSIRNRYVAGRVLRLRPGLRVVNAGGLDPALDKPQHRLRTLLVHVDPQTLDRTVLCGCYSALAKLDPLTGRIVSLPTLTGFVQPSYRQWFANQVRGAAYFSREGTGLLRVTPGSAGRAGIAPPSAAVTIADSGLSTTSLPAGNYVAVARFRNRLTGAVSNYGPVSNTLALTANHGIIVTGVPVSTDFQVDTRDIALTLADRPGTYYELGPFGEVLDNVSTSASLGGFGVDNYGNPLRQVHAAPPSNIACSTWWDAAQVLAYSDGKALFISETGLPESWGGIEFEFGREDGYPIMAVAGRGRELLIGKGNLIGLLTGVDRETFAQDILTEGYGLAAPHTLRSIGASSFWLASAQDGLCVVRSDGASVEPVSTGRIERTLAAIPRDFRSYCFGSIWPRLNLYVLSVSRGLLFNDDGSARHVHDTFLTYNYVDRAWTDRGDFDPRVFARPGLSSYGGQALAPVSLTQFADGDSHTRIYAVFDYSRRFTGDVRPRFPHEFIYEIAHDAVTDIGNPIPWSVTTRAIVAPGRRQHRPRALHLTATPSTPGEGCTVTVSSYRAAAPPDSITPDRMASFILDPSDGAGPQDYILPLSATAPGRPSTTYSLEISGDQALAELHSGAVEMTLTAAHRRARTPRGRSE